MTATVRVETFGLTRPGDIDEIPIENLARHLDRLRAEDREFFEVLDPIPGDIVQIVGDGYYDVRGKDPDDRGRRAVIDGSHYAIDFEDGRGPLVLAVLHASAFYGPGITRANPADNGPEYVSASGGPCPFIPLAELVRVGPTVAHFWRWKGFPEAGGGVDYTRTVTLWTWTPKAEV